jgi:hypothetical protein
MLSIVRPEQDVQLKVQYAMMTKPNLIVFLGSLLLISCGRQSPRPQQSSQQPKDISIVVTQTNIFKFTTTMDKELVDFISVSATGNIDGKAKIIVDQLETWDVSGHIEKSRGYDWFSTNFYLRYEPQGVTTGEMVLRCRFR